MPPRALCIGFESFFSPSKGLGVGESGMVMGSMMKVAVAESLRRCVVFDADLHKRPRTDVHNRPGALGTPESR
jgi:hypothetical protein